VKMHPVLHEQIKLGTYRFSRLLLVQHQTQTATPTGAISCFSASDTTHGQMMLANPVH